jgi:hypothetical protein
MDGDFRSEFVREAAALRQFPALVLNADYRPLSYYPLSLWTWQEAIKAVWADRVDIVAQYDHWVRSPSTEIRIPSVIVLRDYVKPQKRVAFTRFNLFLRDEFRCMLCRARAAGAQAGKTWWRPVLRATCARGRAACGRRV